jgi:hypothetical protein
MNDTSNVALSEDLIMGAGPIAAFLFGDRKARRKVYYLAQRSNAPFFKLKSQWCVRKSELLEYIELQKQKHSARQNHHDESINRDGSQSTTKSKQNHSTDLG